MSALSWLPSLTDGTEPLLDHRDGGSLDATVRALADEFTPFRRPGQGRGTTLQYALLARLLAGPQRTLASLPPAERARYFAEGVERLYLGTRAGLPFHDTFPVVGRRPVGEDAVTSATRVIGTLAHLVRSDSTAAVRLRLWRRAATDCDRLVRDESAAHFVLLRGGVLYRLPLALAGQRARLHPVLRRIARARTLAPRLSLGAGSALARERWAAIESSLVAGSAPTRALDALRRAAFLVCLDDAPRHRVLPGEDARPADPLAPERFVDRCFDKCVQTVIAADGTTSLLCEHGGIDGVEAIALLRRLEPSASAGAATSVRTRATVPPLPAPMRIDLSEALDERTVDAARTELAAAQADAERCVGHWPDFPLAAFDGLNASVDGLVQIAVQIAFRRCTGRLPSVHEPVRPSPGSTRRLAFVSPVSTASARLDAALHRGATRHGVPLLDAALGVHRAAVRRGRHGHAELTHLLALGAVEFADDAARGARVQRRRKRLLGGLSRAFAHLARRDLTVSCGGYGVPVTRFGTIAHRPHTGAIGYVVGDDGLALDTLLHGGLRRTLCAERFAESLRGALHEIIDCRQAGVAS